VITGGNGQAGTIGNTLGVPLGVRVTDQYGNPIAGATVTWTVTAGGGSLSALTTVSDAFGKTSNVWTLGSLVGTQTATASIGGVIATFTAMAAGS
jgi:Bacterial Ig-like domain (group 1)